jgi:iron complex outermembrane receptor protein
VARSQLERVAELGPFVHATYAFIPAVSLSATARYDRVRFDVQDRQLADSIDNSGARTFAAASGSAGIAFAPAPTVTVYANIASSFETPTTTELNNQPPPGGGGFNPSLKPQRAVTVELGARRAGDRFGWSAAAFASDVRNELIAFEDTAVPGRRYFRNAANARHRGLELGAQGRPTAWLDYSVAWTVSHFVYTSHQLASLSLAGRELPGIPRHAVRAALRLEPGAPRGGWAQIDASHNSGYLVDDTADVRTKASLQVDVRLGWSDASRSFAPFVAINNVFDAHYVSSVVINAARGRYYEPAPGRNATIGISIATSRKGG